MPAVDSGYAEDHVTESEGLWGGGRGQMIVSARGLAVDCSGYCICGTRDLPLCQVLHGFSVGWLCLAVSCCAS